MTKKIGSLGLAIAAAAACLLGAAPAGAADVSYYTGSGSAGPDAIGFAEASCPFPGKPTGGGSFSSGGWGQSYLTALELDDADIRETYQAWSFGGAAVTLTATVACVEGNAANGLRYKTKKTRIRADNAKTLEARCPNGFRVVGGEVTHDASGSGLIIQASRPTQKRRAWEGKLLNLSDSAQDMFVTAACASGSLSRSLAYREKSKTAPQGEQGLATSDCPTGTEVVGGGVRVHTPTANVNSSGVQSSGTGSATYVDAASRDTRFTNYAICHG